MCSEHTGVVRCSTSRSPRITRHVQEIFGGFRGAAWRARCQMSLKNDPLLSLKIDPPLLSPSRGSGSVKIPKKHPSYYLSSASIPEAPALIAGLNNFAVVRQPIQQRSGHLLVTNTVGHSPKDRFVVITMDTRS